MRCNIGVNPKFLADQHLVAEYRELPMIVGSLRVNDWKIKSDIPNKFTLGKGHINFFKNKLLYIKNRHNAVKEEMEVRGFKNDILCIDLADNNLKQYCNDWSPSIEDSNIIKNRIEWKLRNKSYSFWRYYRYLLKLEEIEDFIQNINNSSLFHV